MRNASSTEYRRLIWLRWVGLVLGARSLLRPTRLEERCTLFTPDFSRLAGVKRTDEHNERCDFRLYTSYEQ